MTFVPEDLRAEAKKIRDNEPTEPITVRTFLRWFGAERRGFNVVWNIRKALEEVGLITNPDFRHTWLDGAIHFLPVPAVDLDDQRPASAGQTGSVAGPNPVAVTASELSPVDAGIDDPTRRIGQLDAANRGVIYVSPGDSVERAVTLMLRNNYSQLPVMTSAREVKGGITWESIAKRLLFGGDCNRVMDCMERSREISADASIFAAIPEIVKHQYVLVRAADRSITGILTGTDLSGQFQQLAEPFLLLGEIENQIRRLIGNRFTVPELSAAKDPADTERTIGSVADLSLGECIRLLENEERWQKLALKIDRKEFVKEAHRIRNLRNDIMHFDPDPMTADDLKLLRTFAEFLSSLSDLLTQHADPT